MKNTIFTLALLCGTLFAADYADGKAAMNAAKKLEREKKTTEAIQAYQDAAKLTKTPNEQINALTRAGKLLISQKKADEALKILLAFAENTKNPKAQRTMAYLECAKASPKDAVKYYDLGIALKAGDWTEGACFNGKAESLQKEGKNDDAIAIYNQVAANTKYNEVTKAAAYVGLIQIAKQKKDYTAAHNYCANMRELGKKRYAFLILDAGMKEAEVFVAEKKFDDAVKIYTELAANTKLQKNARIRAIESIIVLEFETLNNPKSAQKALELFKANNLPVSKKAKKYEKEIKELLE